MSEYPWTLEEWADAWAMCKAQIGTLDPPPGGLWFSDDMANNWIAGLADVPPSALRAAAPKIVLAFDKRPSCKAFREWLNSLVLARSAGQLPAFLTSGKQPARLTGPAAGRSRDKGRAVPPRLEAPAGGVCAFAAQVLPGPAAREIIARLKAKGGQTEAGPSEFGLQFEILPGFKGAGTVTRTHPSYTKSAAEQAAAERNAKWPHQRTTVFGKEEPARRGAAAVMEKREEALCE